MFKNQIHVAYSYERRNSCYRARAYVGAHMKPMHSITVAIGDNPNEAMDECISYIARIHSRDGVTMPSEIVRHGKVSGAILDALIF